MICKVMAVEDGDLVYRSAYIWCPGCYMLHAMRIRDVGKDIHPSWEFNGDLTRPTFHPSVHVFTSRYDAEGKPIPGTRVTQCHSFITDGRIAFLEDSAHTLKGFTVDLPELPEWFQKF